jgi:hypothetical protein
MNLIKKILLEFDEDDGETFSSTSSENQFKPYYAIETGQQGKLFTLRYHYPHFSNFSQTWEPRSRHVATLGGDLEVAKQKAQKHVPAGTELKIHATSRGEITKNKIDHTVIPFGKYQGKHIHEVPANALAFSLNGGYYNGTKYPKLKANVEAYLQEQGYQKTGVWGWFPKSYLALFDSSITYQTWQEGDKKIFALDPNEKWHSPEEIEKSNHLKAEHDAPKPISDFVGNIGDKIVVDNAKLLFRKEMPGYMGGTTELVMFVDVNGNKYKYFGNSLSGMEKGKVYKIAAQVKKHDEYNGEKSTQVARPKLQLIENKLHEIHLRAILEFLEEAVDRGELLAQKASEITVGDVFPGSRLHQSVTGKQYIDSYITKGFNKIKYITYRGAKKFYLCNPINNHQIPVSGVLRKYAQWVLNNRKIKEAMKVGADGSFKNSDENELAYINKALALDIPELVYPLTPLMAYRPRLIGCIKHVKFDYPMEKIEKQDWATIRALLLQRKKEITN